MMFRLTLNLSYILAVMVILAILNIPITVSLSYAQTASDPLVPNSPSQTREHIVKITSPSKGQQVAVGKGLMISGTSSDNVSKDCIVSVIVDGVKPYHNATGNGVGGVKDYSKWSFVLASAYTTLKQGQNKITARFFCTNDPSLVAHNSVNVTGVSSPTVATNPGKQQATNISAGALLKNASIGITTPLNTTASQNAKSTSGNIGSNANVPPTGNLSSSGTGGNAGNNVMSVSIHLSKRTVQPGDVQTVSAMVTNANSSSAISGANVVGSITDPSGGSFKKLEGTTDSTGKSSYSWTVGQNDATGKYKTVLDVSAPGYANSTASKTFVVLPIGSATNGGGPYQFSTPFTDKHQSNSPSTIIPLPHIRIPIIKIPFHLPFH